MFLVSLFLGAIFTLQGHRGGWVVQKKLKTPLREIMMAPFSEIQQTGDWSTEVGRAPLIIFEIAFY